MTETLHFPDGFLWGTATAAHQVEGGNINNDWWAWEQTPGHIVDGSRSGAACSWWRGRAEEDLSLAAASGHNSHRLSVEWSRLEPTPGRYDDAAFERYRQILQHMRALGMTPMVTLHHFTLPLWQSTRGGWLDDEIAARFRAYAAECARRLGDLVTLWCTINEPLNLLYFGYFGKRWPPGGGQPLQWPRVAANLFRVHAAAYAAIHAVQPEAEVGLVHIMQAIDPASPRSPLDRFAAWLQDFLSIESWLRPMRTGRLVLPWGLFTREVPGLAGAADFYGVNYYGAYRVRFDPTMPLLGRWVEEGTISSGTDNWGACDPAGLRRAILRAAALGQPVYVTENGIFDPTDARRQRYLVHNLAAAHEAIAAGADLRGYYHWTLVDNFEWAEGWTTPFGLIELNPATQARRPRRSFELYGAIATANAIRADIAAEYLR
ncbi:MAG: family 1 glycosylhydrolase [Ardenticatenaceae bacterium]|nr:family 1 glycosylhydrolase [Ardenticatenaceae bacterium]